MAPANHAGRTPPAVTLVAAAAILAGLTALVMDRSAERAGAHITGKTEVIFVGNNWDGTVQVLSSEPPFEPVAPPINAIPDFEERMAAIASDPVDLAYFLGIRALVGEGNDQYVDDMYASNDGRFLIASRPSFADVVAIELATGEIAWRFPVAGQRSDHMAISPDGRHVAVSASTGNVVHILDVRTGEEVDQFPSGDSPHENTYSRDGEKLFHASIGLVYTPADQPQADSTKGERVFEVVKTDGYDVTQQLDMGQELEEAGYPDMSSAVRPMALAPKERKVFFQVSFFHGFVQYSFRKDRVIRVVDLPNEVPEMPREQYLLDSAHHGIAISPDGRKLCVAGTMSDYVAMVNRAKGFSFKLFHEGEKPYWATTSSDGKYCLVSWSGTDQISVFSYKKSKEIADVDVGNHPQRVRMGYVRNSWLHSQPAP